MPLTQEGKKSRMHLNLNTITQESLRQQIIDVGFCIVEPNTLAELLQLRMQDLLQLDKYWEDLHQDKFLKDHGAYRSRRHSSYVVENGLTHLMPHRAHWQSTEYNALHGGIKRLFEPINEELNTSKLWLQLISSIAKLLDGVQKIDQWYTEAHQFRINTSNGLGRPTPEGAHRDGVDYVAIILIKRAFVKGGETRIFEINGNEGIRFTLDKPWTMLLLDDHRLIHETTPIQAQGGSGFRDTLVLTFRAKGFQDPEIGLD